MEKVLRKDADWVTIENEACKVNGFTTLAKIENRKISFMKSAPYAAVNLTCAKLDQEVIGFIYHKTDFLHLWTVFNVRGVSSSEEVIIFWSKRHFKWLTRFASSFLPSICVMVCKTGAYDLISDPDSSPELQGEARWLAEEPVVILKPEVWT